MYSSSGAEARATALPPLAVSVNAVNVAAASSRVAGRRHPALTLDTISRVSFLRPAQNPSSPRQGSFQGGVEGFSLYIWVQDLFVQGPRQTPCAAHVGGSGSRGALAGEALAPSRQECSQPSTLVLQPRCGSVFGPCCVCRDAGPGFVVACLRWRASRIVGDRLKIPSREVEDPSRLASVCPRYVATAP